MPRVAHFHHGKGTLFVEGLYLPGDLIEGIAFDAVVDVGSRDIAVSRIVPLPRALLFHAAPGGRSGQHGPAGEFFVLTQRARFGAPAKAQIASRALRRRLRLIGSTGAFVARFCPD